MPKDEKFTQEPTDFLGGKDLSAGRPIYGVIPIPGLAEAQPVPGEPAKPKE